MLLSRPRSQAAAQASEPALCINHTNVLKTNFEETTQPASLLLAMGNRHHCIHLNPALLYVYYGF